MSVLSYETTRYTVMNQDSGNVYPALMKEAVQMLIDHTTATLYETVEDSSACYRALLHVGDDWYLRCSGGLATGESTNSLNVYLGTIRSGAFSSLMGGGGRSNYNNKETYCALKVVNGGDAWRFIAFSGSSQNTNHGHASMMKIRGSLGANLIAAEAGEQATWGMGGYVFDSSGVHHSVTSLFGAGATTPTVASIFPDGTELLFPALLGIAGGLNRIGIITINGKIPYASSAAKRGTVGALEEYSIDGTRYVNLGAYSILST